MSNFTVKDPPEYNDEMRMLEPTDPAHADVFNALFEQLINNDAFLATLARKTAEVVEEFIISKGMPKGIASLDESGNVPKEQIKLAAEDVGALPLFENRLTLRETGWYRICQPKFGNATSFSIRFIKDHGEGEVLSLNISATEYKIENIGHYNVYISQLLKQGDAILDKIRIVSSDEMNPVYIDIHYTLNEENNFCIQIDSVLSNGDKNFNIELLEKNPQIFETQSIHEWNYTRNGLIADSAIEDGEGNNIAETYFTNTKGDELKKSVSDGKKLVANAITAKGVTTAVDAAFATIATNISQITTGVDTSDANAGVEHILSGKTAYVNEVKITGTMANRGSVTSALNAGDSYTIPSGFHNGSGKVTANSLASQTQGTATDSEVLQGKTAWVNGAKVTGSIPKAPTFPNENSGLDLHLYGSTPGGQDHNIFMMIPKGYYNETWVGYKDQNLIPANIKKGVKIGGGMKLVGTYEGNIEKKTYSGVLERGQSKDITLKELIPLYSLNWDYCVILTEVWLTKNRDDETPKYGYSYDTTIIAVTKRGIGSGWNIPKYPYLHLSCLTSRFEEDVVSGAIDTRDFLLNASNYKNRVGDNLYKFLKATNSSTIKLPDQDWNDTNVFPIAFALDSDTYLWTHYKCEITKFRNNFMYPDSIWEGYYP